MVKTLAVCMFLTLGVGTGGQATTPADDTRQVTRQVYVKPMGNDHEAVRFRKLMSDHLIKLGHAVTSDAATADLVLETTLSTPVVSGETRAYASAEVRNREGKIIWTGEFPASEGWVQTKARDAVRKLAEEIAAALVRRSTS